MTRFKPLLTAAAVALSCSAFALPALAESAVVVTDAYARVSTPMSKSGAAFLVIENHAATDDRLIKASSDIADRVELHTHKADANGVMQMLEVKEGFPVPAHGMHALKRGGDHVMFLGLKQPLKDGDVVEVTLTFEQAGEMTVEIPVDTKRGDDGMPMTPAEGMPMQGMDHSMHGASN